MLYSRAQVGGRAAWMGLRRRVFEAQSHPLVVARKQRLAALRQKYFLRRGNDNKTVVTRNIRNESNGIRENEVTTISQAWQKYGWLAIGTHFSVYFATLALSFGFLFAITLSMGCFAKTKLVQKTCNVVLQAAAVRSWHQANSTPQN